MQIGCGILAVFNDCAPGEEAAYEHWYLGEHLPERLAIPGFRWGRRYRRVAGTSTALPEYMTYYEVDAPEVLTSDAYLARVNDPTPETHRIMMTVFQNMNRTICRRIAGAGNIRGGYVVAVVSTGDTILPLDDLPASESLNAWRELWQSAEPADQSVSEEERLRGRDAKISSCLLADCQTREEATDLATEMKTSGQISIYQFTGSLNASDL